MISPTTPRPQAPLQQSARHPEFSLDRVSHLIAALEQELANAPPDLPNVQDLRQEIETLKRTLASPEQSDSGIDEGLYAIRDRLQDMTARVEGEVLKDSPYITEIGRILGLV